MTKKERYEKVIAWFQENVPVAGRNGTALQQPVRTADRRYPLRTVYRQAGEHDHP